MLIIPRISSSVLQMTEAVQYVNITSLVPTHKPSKSPSLISQHKIQSKRVASFLFFGPMTYYESDRNVIKKPFSEGHSTRVLDISFQINNIRDNILLRIGFERKLKLFLRSGSSLTNYLKLKCLFFCWIPDHGFRVENFFVLCSFECDQICWKRRKKEIMLAKEDCLKI